MPFKKKGDRVDIHVWLRVQHAEVLDAICKKYEISRAEAIGGLIEDYQLNHKDQKNDNA
jgi:hypothetical protein